uniref:Uncharacterized protein n=1 Tax=mine drainage metagenome TaxID=410659 RepID=E6QFJ8_9ZZZZ
MIGYSPYDFRTSVAVPSDTDMDDRSNPVGSWGSIPIQKMGNIKCLGFVNNY